MKLHPLDIFKEESLKDRFDAGASLEDGISGRVSIDSDYDNTQTTAEIRTNDCCATDRG